MIAPLITSLLLSVCSQPAQTNAADVAQRHRELTETEMAAGRTEFISCTTTIAAGIDYVPFGSMCPPDFPKEVLIDQAGAFAPLAVEALLVTPSSLTPEDDLKLWMPVSIMGLLLADASRCWELGEREQSYERVACVLTVAPAFLRDPEWLFIGDGLSSIPMLKLESMLDADPFRPSAELVEELSIDLRRCSDAIREAGPELDQIREDVRQMLIEAGEEPRERLTPETIGVLIERLAENE